MDLTWPPSLPVTQVSATRWQRSLEGQELSDAAAPTTRRATGQNGAAMSIESAERFFAFLTIAALAGVIVGISGRAVPSAAVRGLVLTLRSNRLLVGALVADTAMVGSLYFSEVGHLTPCLFCWYQRCTMYPLAVILPIAAVRRDDGVRPYALALAIIGALLSSYHYALEWIHSLDTGACSATVPCTFVYFRQFGFMSLSFMALAGFLFLITLFTLPGETS